MKETERLIQIFEKTYDGDAWIGETLMGTLKGISAEKAAKKIDPWNSIWQIANHIIAWRENVLERVQGSIKNAPGNNYFTPVINQSEQAWQETLQRLKNSEEHWISFLRQMNEEELEKIYPNNNASYYHNIHGIIQHDAYHLGQIILLAKLS